MAGDEARELLERVTAATGPDRELDARLWCLAEGRKFRKMLSPPVAFRTSGGDVGLYDASRYTASIDAALALVERVRPGHFFTLNTRAPWATLYAVSHVEPGAWTGRGATLPLAILAALLTALQQDAETTQAGEGR